MHRYIRRICATLLPAFPLVCVFADKAYCQADVMQAALQVLHQNLDNGSVPLSTMVTEWGATLSLPADSLQARVQTLIQHTQVVLQQPTCQDILKQRWEESDETKVLDTRRGLAFIQELTTMTSRALLQPEQYTLGSLVTVAARKKGIPISQAVEVLRVAVGGRIGKSIARAPIDTLYLQVLSEELLELAPGILDSYESALSYHKYWHVLSPSSVHTFFRYFLTDMQKCYVWNLAARDLLSNDVCRGVASPPHRLPLQYPLLVIYATLEIPEAYAGRVHQYGSREIGQYRGMPRPASKRRITHYSLNLHQTLTLGGSLQPIWEDLGAVALKVTEYGPHPGDPDGTGSRTYPVKVEYQESIIEPVFIEFLREKLCPAVR